MCKPIIKKEMNISYFYKTQTACIPRLLFTTTVVTFGLPA